MGVLLFVSCSQRNSEIAIIPFETEEGYQYVNKEGEIVINPKWRSADLFFENLARVQTNDDLYKWGFIDDEGEVVVEPLYKSITRFSEGIAFLVPDSMPPTAINPKGEKLFELPFAEKVGIFNDGLAPFGVRADNDYALKWGFINSRGKVVIEPQFSAVDHFAGGVCPVMDENGDWGYINDDGELIINYQFDRAFPFVDDIAVVTLGRDFGAIDKEGRYIINPQYEELQIDGDWFLIAQDDKYGWIDREGAYVINPQFEGAYPFNGKKLAPVIIGDSDKWGYIDEKGLIKINPQFRHAYPFDDDVALVYTNNRYGFIDDEGKFLVNPQFADLSNAYKEHWRNFKISPERFMVETDYFNRKDLLDSVKTLIANNNFHNLLFEDTLAGIMNKLALKSKDMSSKSDGYGNYVLFNSYVTNDAKVSFSVKIKAYNAVRVRRNSGGYSYYDTDYVLNESAFPEKFTYIFSLNNRGRGKAPELKDEIFKMLENYEFIGEDRNGYKSYRKDKYVYRVGNYYGNTIKIEISKS